MTAASIPPQTDKSNLWEPKRTLTLEAARKHSQYIHYLRWILLLTAFGLVIGLIIIFMQQPPTSLPEDNAEDAVKMTNPRYAGRTDDGLPFYLTAAEAVRKTDSETTVDLVKPVLEFYRQKDSELSTIDASTGLYDDAQKILTLHQTVILKTDDGNQCTTTHARIYARTKTVEGDEPIHCTGEFGEIEGSAYEIRDDFSTFIFKNGMSAVLEPTP